MGKAEPVPCTLKRRGGVCGGAAEVVGGRDFFSVFFCFCKACKSSTQTALTREEAVAAWNRWMDARGAK